MASILLPPCIAVKSLVASSIPIAQSSIALAQGYAGGVAPVVASLTTATTTLAGVTAILTPAAAVAPPCVIGLNTVAGAVSQIVTINASIVAAGVQAVAVAGLPSPTFPVAAQLVVTQLTALDTYIQTILITPQL